MRITFTTDHDRRMIFSTATGAIALADFLEHVNARGAAGVLGYDQVLDMRAATYAFGPPDIKKIVEEIRAGRQKEAPGELPGYSAVVAAADVTYGTARQLCTHAEFLDHKAEVFRTVDEALEWLSVERGTTRSASTTSAD